eukprot:TRINITY_DN19272_c0_g1_i2.p1 TRINITY_DN19272_c0_g1~~TRINITY_DN19272_c0_g1_i2.p1  ORF type:complete len:548 (+),score=126.28 TRINITY_DN19272_c0_g1_i2:221-1864(+)
MKIMHVHLSNLDESAKKDLRDGLQMKVAAIAKVPWTSVAVKLSAGSIQVDIDIVSPLDKAASRIVASLAAVRLEEEVLVVAKAIPAVRRAAHGELRATPPVVEVVTTARSAIDAIDRLVKESELRSELDFTGGTVVLEDELELVDDEEEEEEGEYSEDEEDTDSEDDPKVPNGAGVGDLYDSPYSKAAMEELHGLKEEVSGLRSKVTNLQRDNGALRTVLCVHAGGSLPVDFVPEQMKGGSPMAPAAALKSGELPPLQIDAARAEEDELTAAVSPPPVKRTELRLAPPERSRGLCAQGGILAGCYSCDSAEESYLEVPVRVQVGSRDVPAMDFLDEKSSPISPIATTAAASSFNGSRLISDTSPASPATPWTRPSPLAREPPMSASPAEIPNPFETPRRPVLDQRKQHAWRHHEEVEPLADRLAGRPRPVPLALNSSAGSSYNFSVVRENSFACVEDLDGAEAPPEEVPQRPPSPPSPPLAPVATWTPGIGQSMKASPQGMVRKPLVLPFPGVPLDIVGALHPSQAMSSSSPLKTLRPRSGEQSWVR